MDMELQMNTLRESPSLADAIEMASHEDLANVWLEVTESKIYCIECEGHSPVFYKFNTSSFICDCIGINQFAELVKHELRAYLFRVKKYNTDKRLIELIKKMGSRGTSKSVAESAMMKIYDPSFLRKLDQEQHIINFKNGGVDLRTGEFKARTKDDLFSRCLEYDYTSKKSKKEMRKEVENLLMNICNDDQEVYDFALLYLGYCLTGEVREQKLLYLIGHSASNGKSTLIKIFQKCFGCYTRKLVNETFNIGYGKVHKQIAGTKGIRLCYVEELNTKKQDTSLIKTIVDVDEYHNEKMYGTTELIDIRFKLAVIGNHDPNNGNCDEGIKRRGIMINFTNQFLAKEDFKNAKGTYLKDRSVVDKFKQDAYKLCLFEILLEYASKYYKCGLSIPEKLLVNFANLCSENDKMRDFLDAQFVITQDPADKIHKQEFTDMYNEHHGLFRQWTDLLSDVKRCGIKYDRVLRVMHNGKSQKGVLLGLRVRGDHEADDMVVEKVTKISKKMKGKKKPVKNSDYEFVDDSDDDVNQLVN